MVRSLSVHLLPALFEPQILLGGTAVILDILRASSTMTTALQNGAACVAPFADIEQAVAFRGASPVGQVLLGGERGGIRIKGFDLSNSPADYSHNTVSGRIVGFTTTNGTRALLRSAKATDVIVGCFLNISAVVEFICLKASDVHLVCAGTDGNVTGEDILCAGAITDALTHRDASNSSPTETSTWQLNDSAVIARSYWQTSVAYESDRTRQRECDWMDNERTKYYSAILASVMCNTQGGRNLLRLGYGDDIERCSQLHASLIVPRFDSQSQRITV